MGQNGLPVPQDSPNNGMFINQADPAKPLRNVTIDRCQIHWQGGRALQLFASGKIISPTIWGSGNGTTSPKITCSAPQDGGIIELHRAATGDWAGGVKRSDIYFADGAGSTGAWPSYVRVF